MNETVPEVENPPSAEATEIPAEENCPAECEAAAAAEIPAEENCPAECEAAAAAEIPAEENCPAEVKEGAAEPSMAWHRFLTCFGLWAEALFHGLQAGWMLRGGQYYAAELREMAYAGLPLLRMLDRALAGVAAVAALLCVLSAVKLRKRRRSGPGLLCGTYILLLAGQLGLAAGRYFIIGLTPLSMSTLGPMLVYLMLLPVNGVYYRRRRGCFARLNQTEEH